MKQLFPLLLITVYSFTCNAQELALLTASDHQSSFINLTSAPHGVGGTRGRSSAGSVGSWLMFGGAVVTIVGYIDVKHSTKAYGPFTFRDQPAYNTARAIEITGGAMFTAGLIIVIVDKINRSSGRHDKVSITAPKNNEIGIAYKF